MSENNKVPSWVEYSFFFFASHSPNFNCRQFDIKKLCVFFNHHRGGLRHKKARREREKKNFIASRSEHKNFHLDENICSDIKCVHQQEFEKAFNWARKERVEGDKDVEL